MVSTILVPLDGSALAQRALPYGATLARAAGARLIALCARSPLAIRSEPDFDPSVVADSMRGGGVEVEPRVVDVYRGEVAGAICEAAGERRADLIVMSTHGRGGLGRWLYGSVADRVLRRATVPVILVSPACDRRWRDGQAMRLMVSLDGSELAEAALAPAGELAAALGGELLLVRLAGRLEYGYADGVPYLEKESESSRELAEAREYLDRVAERLRKDGRTAEIHTRASFSPPALADIAREREADLIAMATHGRGGLARLVMGSVATATLQRATTPVLLVRPAALHAAAEPSPAAPETAPAPATPSQTEPERLPAQTARPGARPRDPFQMLEEMQEDLARLWSRGWPFGAWPRWPALRPDGMSAAWAPRADVFEVGGELVVKAELPGAKREDVDVFLDDGDLVIRGERRSESEVNEGHYHRMERSYGSFYRRLPLPFEATAEQVRASFADGVLEIRIPKPAEEKARPRRIPIA